jgi:biopolymer transport protein ExbD
LRGSDFLLILGKYTLKLTMNKRFLFVFILISLLIGCRYGRNETPKLNIVLFGYDSIACYYGSSADLTDLRRGLLTDKLFIDTILTTAKDREPVSIVLKPVCGGSVMSNYMHLDTLLALNDFKNRTIDTLDEKEQEFFNATSVLTFLKEHEEPLKLFLPKESNKPSHVSLGNELVVLILNESEVYVYTGKQIKDGNRITYAELKKMLAVKRSKYDFFVVIKPGERCSYKSTVDVLDLMTIEKIKNYSMEDVSNDEKAFLRSIE